MLLSELYDQALLNAHKNFERDKRVGCYPSRFTWEDLGDEQLIYMAEAIEMIQTGESYVDDPIIDAPGAFVKEE